RELPDEQSVSGDRHCRYYSEFLDRRRTSLKGGQQAVALAEINAEIGNIRSAWQWAVAHGQDDAIRQCLETLILFYDTQSWYHEGAETFARAAEAWPARPQAAATEPTLSRLKI